MNYNHISFILNIFLKAVYVLEIFERVSYFTIFYIFISIGILWIFLLIALLLKLEPKYYKSPTNIFYKYGQISYFVLPFLGQHFNFTLIYILITIFSCKQGYDKNFDN